VIFSARCARILLSAAANPAFFTPSVIDNLPPLNGQSIYLHSLASGGDLFFSPFWVRPLTPTDFFHEEVE